MRQLVLAVAILLVAIVGVEWQLSARGYVPTVEDSTARWIQLRQRANALGDKALVLVGASRIQLGVDLPTLRARSGREPVQLAIDGSSYLPVLRGLADDPEFKGSVIVDYYDATLAAAPNKFGSGYVYQRKFEQYASQPKSARIEDRLSELLHENITAYSDGGRPFDAVRARVLAHEERRQYLVTLPDRSRRADYGQVDMPAFYHSRVALMLTGASGWNPAAPETAAKLAQAARAVQADSGFAFEPNLEAVKKMVSSIRARGGEVYFIVMPTSGLVREIEQRRYPREKFLDRFIATIDAPLVQSAATARLSGFRCPDGSHLDTRDRIRFTEALSQELGFERGSAKRRD